MTSTPATQETDRLLFEQHLDDIRAWRRKKAHDLSLQIDGILRAELLRRIRLDKNDTPANTPAASPHQPNDTLAGA